VNGLLGGAVEGICERLGVHPLVVEDILDCNQRPKVENYDDYLFIVTKMLSLHEDGFIEYEQVCLIVTDSVVVTFQETPGDCFGPLRERIATGGGRLRHSGSDYLAYAILDVIVDNYYRVLEHIGDNLDRFEMQAADPSEARSYMTELQGQREELLKLRRILWPVRDSIASLSRVEGGRLSADLFPFLRDLQENIIQVVEAVETYREHASSILEIHLASVSNRMNEVMKVLTVISTIFIPLTFLAGVYGMNFQHMPELALRWAYPALLLFMAALAGAMLVFFKRKHWF
jgi:magnesium transporter